MLCGSSPAYSKENDDRIDFPRWLFVTFYDHSDHDRIIGSALSRSNRQLKDAKRHNTVIVLNFFKYFSTKIIVKAYTKDSPMSKHMTLVYLCFIVDFRNYREDGRIISEYFINIDL